MNSSPKHYAHSLLTVFLCLFSVAATAQDWSPVTTFDGSNATARHESASVEYNGMIYLFGGRGERPVERYDPATNTWEIIALAPLELHHFQPILYSGKIYIVGALACCYPREPTVTDVHVFDPADSSWSTAGTMPVGRERGAAGTVLRNGKIYLIGGNTLGHDGGAVPWFDEFDPATGQWTVLPDAPNARDHFHAGVIGSKLIAAGGRQSARSVGNTVAATDVYDFNTGSWTSEADIPTVRAGTMAAVFGNRLFVIGGESAAAYEAHKEVEVFDPSAGNWQALTDMLDPRHAGGATLIGDQLHVMAGSTTRGAAGETNVHESIDLSQAQTTDINPPPAIVDSDGDGLSDDDENNIYNTNPNNADTDADGINDSDELNVSNTDPLDADTDGDGIEDKDEIDSNLDPTNSDTDGDGLSDGDEVQVHFTAADNPDSDADGVADGAEVNDYSTDPLNTDSDNDSISDGDEILVHLSNPNLADSDADGLSDSDEINTHQTSPTSADSDSDGLSDIDELNVYLTNPTAADSDGDSVSDGDEVTVHQSNPNAADSDGDGISDGDELGLGSSLTNLDDDNDGLTNSAEGTADTDADGIPNYRDRDSDNDGIPDLLESGFTDVNQNGQLDTAAEIAAAEDNAEEETETTEDTVDGSSGQSVSRSAQATSTHNLLDQAPDADGDGIPNFLDLDSDQDTIPDRVEGSGNYDSMASTFSYNQADDADLDGQLDITLTTIAADTDSDGVANFLDLDSDDDGVNDITEFGATDYDLDLDGRVDSGLTLNSHGLFENPELAAAVPDEDGDNIPDVIDSEYTRKNLLGCTIGTPSDPMFPMIVLTAFALLWLRRNNRTSQQLPASID